MENIAITDADSPNRCQAVTTKGQCRGVKEPGRETCRMHGGAQKSGIKNYQLTKFKARLDRIAESPDLKSLRDEVAILRMMLEERLEQCKDSMDLIYSSGPISDLVSKIERTVVSCNKLELVSGALLDKQAIMQFGSELVALLGVEIKDEALLARLSEKIYATISRTLSCDEEESTGSPEVTDS